MRSLARGASLALCLALGACQSAGPGPVYLDPASNLGAPSGIAAQQPGTPPMPAQATPMATGPAAAADRDAQGQPNDEFDGQSWIEYRRSRPEVAPRPRVRGGGRTETIPLLPSPGEVELDPRMYDPSARR